MPVNRIDIILEEEIKFIINTLNRNGFEAYLVGGCVRDILMGKKPKDWDIATSALPHQVMSLFDKTIGTGLKHGTVTVVLGSQKAEVTTFRIEGKYSDHRRPDYVLFTNSLEDDLRRRDFTINSIAYHPDKGYIDPFNGIQDIDKGIIRSVGDAGERFTEDALRMLRAVRFSAQLGFKIDQDVIKSIENKKALITNISMERIRDELDKILLSPYPDKFIILKETGLLHYILPELDRYPDCMLKYIIKGLKNIRCDRTLRWAMLLHKEGKESTVDILRRLRFDNKTVSKAGKLVESLHMEIQDDAQNVRIAAVIAGEEIFPDILELKEAVLRAKGFSADDMDIKKISKIKQIYTNAKEKKECMSIKDLAVNGNDLINAGFREGKEVGKLLNELLMVVAKHPEMNSKDILLDLALKLKTEL